MKAIYLASCTPYVGKNVVCVGLVHCLRNLGRTVGYFKPYGPFAVDHEDAWLDPDALFFKKALDLPDAVEDICPVVLTPQASSDMLRGADLNARERILAAFERVAAGKDAVVCAGMSGLASGLAAGFPMPEIVEALDATVLMIDRYRYTFECLDSLLEAKRTLGERFAGVIFNRVREAVTSEVQNAVAPYLEERGIPVLGLLNEDPVLGAVPIRQAVNVLGARVLCGSEKLDELIEGFTIGAMNVEAAMRYFRRSRSRAVITGGDRADMQLAAIEAGAKCLILTGDLYPSERIITHAEEKGVPLLLASADTATVVGVCEGLSHELSLNSERKLGRIQKVFEERIGCERLLEALGIER